MTLESYSDPEDEDLDDLDDVLPGFNKPPAQPQPQPASHPKPDTITSAPNKITGAAYDRQDEQVSDAAFEAELAKEMESLLASLTASTSTAPASTDKSIPGSSSQKSKLGSKQPSAVPPQDAGMETLLMNMLKSQGINLNDLLPDELADLKDFQNMGSAKRIGKDEVPANLDDQAMQNMLQEMLKNDMEGMQNIPGFEDLLKAMDQQPGSNGTPQKKSSKPKPNAKELSFEESIAQTMQNMKLASEEAQQPTASTSTGTDTDPLMNLLSQLTSNPDFNLEALQNASNGDDDGQMNSVLDGMMKQLMTRDILQEPLQELSEKYPTYLANNPSIPANQLAAYKSQYAIIQQILTLFKSPSYSDDKPESQKQVWELMNQMQELGSPPEEVLGEMPEGLGFGEEGCVIM